MSDHVVPPRYVEPGLLVNLLPVEPGREEAEGEHEEEGRCARFPDGKI